MNPESVQAVTPSITDIIDRRVLIVSPQTTVFKVIQQMSTVQDSDPLAASSEHPPLDPDVLNWRASCALILEQDTIVGIFTERDIVRLTAANRTFDQLTIGEVMTTPVKVLRLSEFQDIFAVLFLFRRYQVRHLPIVDNTDKLLGLVTPESIRRVLRPVNLLKLRRVADVMTKSVIHASQETPVIELAHLMADNHVSCVVVSRTDHQPIQQGEKQVIAPLGIVTERDIVQFQALQLDLNQLKAGDVMSTPLFLVSPEDSLWTVYQEMQKRHVRRLVVSWNWGMGLGLVTQTSLLKIFDPIEMYGIIETLQRTIHQLCTSISQTHSVPETWSGPNLDPQAATQPGVLSISSLETISQILSDPMKVRSDPATDIEALFSDIEFRLINLTVNANISEQQRQMLIYSVLASLQKVQAVIRG